MDGIRAHVDALENLEGLEVIFPGHGEPIGLDYLDTYRAYLDFYESQVPLATDQADLVARVWRAHRDWRSLAGLRFSATAHIESRNAAAESADNVGGEENADESATEGEPSE